MNKKIFISYRREDSQGVTGRLYDRLETRFGRDRIFMDVDTIQPGMDFVDAIENAINASDVVLVMIGPNWTTSVDSAGQRRLENPVDFVRLEVATALARNVRVIPVLVSNAPMPIPDHLPSDLKNLSRRNAIEISHTRFNTDADRLIRVLEDIYEKPQLTKSGDVIPDISKPEKTPRLSSGAPKTKTALSHILSIAYWTIGGFMGGYYHWGTYRIANVLLYAGTSGLFSGIGLSAALRKEEPDGWIKEILIAVFGNIIIGGFVRDLFNFNYGADINPSLPIPPLVTATLYFIWKKYLSKAFENLRQKA